MTILNYWCPLKNRDTALNNRFIGKYAVIRFGALGFSLEEAGWLGEPTLNENTKLRTFSRFLHGLYH